MFKRFPYEQHPSGFCIWVSFVFIVWCFPGSAQAFFEVIPQKAEKKETAFPRASQEKNRKTIGDLVAEAKQQTVSGRFDEAVRLYNTAIERHPEDAVLYFERGSLYYYLLISQQADGGEADGGEKVGREAIGDAKPQGEGSRKGGEGTKGRCEDICALALSNLDRAISLDEGYDIFYYMRGMLHASEICPRQDLEQAIADYDRALARNPSRAVYYLERALAKSQRGQQHQALGDIDQAIRLDPANYHLRFEKGRIQENLERFGGAADSYKAALEIAAGDHMPPLIQALNLSRKGNRSQLISDYGELIRRRPSVASFYIQRGFCYGDLGVFGKAVDDLSTALFLQDDRRGILFHRGKMLYEAGRHEQAREDFIAACSLNEPAACHYARVLSAEIERGVQWVRFWYSRDRRLYFYDRSRIRKPTALRRVVPVRIETDEGLGHDRLSEGRIGHSLQVWEFLCSRSQVRVKSQETFDRRGRRIAFQPEMERTFRAVFPGGISEKLLKIACGEP